MQVRRLGRRRPFNGARIPAAPSSMPDEAHTGLLERYLHRLQADPAIVTRAARMGCEGLLAWAADELRHTAGTLSGLSPEDAEYELEAVLREVMERLELAPQTPQL